MAEQLNLFSTISFQTPIFSIGETNSTVKKTKSTTPANLLKGQKKLNQLLDSATELRYALLNGGDCFAKKEYASIAKSFLKHIAKDLALQGSPRYNEAGPAVSGDAYICGMWGESNGVYITFSNDMGNFQIMYRKINSPTDYRGGRNCWIPSFIIDQGYDAIVKTILQIKHESYRQF